MINFLKNTFIVFSIFPLFSAGQDCKLKKTTDEFTREEKISTGFFNLQKVSLSVSTDKKEIDFFFSMNSRDKCFDNASELTVFFEGNRQKNSFKNNGSMNCEGLFHVIIRNGTQTPYFLQRISSQKVVSIKFTGNNNAATTITLSPEQQQTLMKMASCIAQEAKVLAGE